MQMFDLMPNHMPLILIALLYFIDINPKYENNYLLNLDFALMQYFVHIFSLFDKLV